MARNQLTVTVNGKNSLMAEGNQVLSFRILPQQYYCTCRYKDHVVLRWVYCGNGALVTQVRFEMNFISPPTQKTRLNYFLVYVLAA
jgi:hypothetical protein